MIEKKADLRVSTDSREHALIIYGETEEHLYVWAFSTPLAEPSQMLAGWGGFFLASCCCFRTNKPVLGVIINVPLHKNILLFDVTPKCLYDPHHKNLIMDHLSGVSVKCQYVKIPICPPSSPPGIPTFTYCHIQIMPGPLSMGFCSHQSFSRNASLRNCKTLWKSEEGQWHLLMNSEFLNWCQMPFKAHCLTLPHKPKAHWHRLPYNL